MLGWLVMLVAVVVVYRLFAAKLHDVEDAVARQQRTIDDLVRRLEAVSRADTAAVPRAPAPSAATAEPRPAPTRIPTPTQPAPAPPRAIEKPAVVPPPVLHEPP